MILSTFSLAILTLLGVVSFCAFPVLGHGRLMNPPARSSMWREGFNTPINYNDHELFCGGFRHQVSLGYKCGICGDPYDGERENEAGGLYATGTIGRTYRQGQDAVFQVNLTANHKGYFEFRVCPTNSPAIKATKECLDQNLLVLDNGADTKHYIDFGGTGLVNVTVRLPHSLKCDFCVVQWRYHAGNSWGTDADGTSCLGCGYQEEFYGCADVRILEDGASSSSQSPASTTTTTTATTTSTTTPEQSTTTTSTTTTTTTPAPGNHTCRSHSGTADLDQWCVNNCARDYCPSNMCTCDPGPRLTCVGVGLYSNSDSMRNWCLVNCGMGNCPTDVCSCSYVPV